MRKIGIAAFTERGRALADRLEQILSTERNEMEAEILRYEKNLKQWCGKCFEEAEGILFIGACGIAVRTIAPFLKSKTTDPAVLVLDEAGQFVISLLSGHIGGANEFALTIAEAIGAIPVITTASDVNGKLAVDVFAKKNGLAIGSMQAAKRIAAAILRGERVGVYCTGVIEDELPPELSLISESREERAAKRSSAAGLGEEACVLFSGKADHLIWISEYIPDRRQLASCLSKADGTVLHLIPQAVILGAGCRRGKRYEEIKYAVDHVLEETQIAPQALCLAASIDLKKNEPGLLELCGSYGIELCTYPAEELERVQGDFKPSEFVRRTTGVDNVCERAALLAAGAGGRIIHKKYAENGVTAALAVREWRIRFGK